MRLKWRSDILSSQSGRWAVSSACVAGKFWDYSRSAIVGQHVQFSSKCYTFTHCRLHWLSASHTLIHVSTLIAHKCFSQVPAGLGAQQPQPQSNLLVQDTEGILQCTYTVFCILPNSQVYIKVYTDVWDCSFGKWSAYCISFHDTGHKAHLKKKMEEPSKTSWQIDSSDIGLCNE